MINLILWIIFGALVGWLASIIMGRNAQMGALANIVVGIVGAFVGGIVWGLITSGGPMFSRSFSILSIIVALVGAIIVIWIVGMLRRA